MTTEYTPYKTNIYRIGKYIINLNNVNFIVDSGDTIEIEFSQRGKIKIPTSDEFTYEKLCKLILGH